jgi:hypothetical protein
MEGRATHMELWRDTCDHVLLMDTSCGVLHVWYAVVGTPSPNPRSWHILPLPPALSGVPYNLPLPPPSPASHLGQELAEVVELDVQLRHQLLDILLRGGAVWRGAGRGLERGSPGGGTGAWSSTMKGVVGMLTGTHCWAYMTSTPTQETSQEEQASGMETIGGQAVTVSQLSTSHNFQMSLHDTGPPMACTVTQADTPPHPPAPSPLILYWEEYLPSASFFMVRRTRVSCCPGPPLSVTSTQPSTAPRLMYSLTLSARPSSCDRGSSSSSHQGAPSGKVILRSSSSISMVDRHWTEI